MNAIILPFERPLRSDCQPPPLVTFARCGTAIFVGTRDQLIGWCVANESMFPADPKRTAYGDDWSVNKRRLGFYEVRRDNAPTSVLKAASEIMGGDTFEAIASRAFLDMHALKMGLFEVDKKRLKKAHFSAFDKIETAFMRTAIDAAILAMNAKD